jgi:hypothetical protein
MIIRAKKEGKNFTQKFHLETFCILAENFALSYKTFLAVVYDVKQ